MRYRKQIRPESSWFCESANRRRSEQSGIDDSCLNNSNSPKTKPVRAMESVARTGTI